MTFPLPGLPSFDYHRPQSLEEAADLLCKHPQEARVFSGGTDLFVQMREGKLRPGILVDLKRLPGMNSVEFDPKSGLQIGAGTNMNVIARHPAVQEHYSLLVEAIGTVASYQLRNRASMGGNLCNASPAADTAPAALVFEASLVVGGAGQERTIPVVDFFTGPGECLLERGELLRRIDLPLPPTGARGRYLKLGRNAEGDLAIVGVAVLGFPDPGTESGFRFRIAMASVAPTPLRAWTAEQVLADMPLGQASIELASAAASEAASPIDDLRGSALYRTQMVNVFTRRALESVAEMLRGEG